MNNEFREKQYRERIRLWLLGEITGARGKTNIAQWIRRWLIETYGEKCSLCGWAERNPKTNKVPVEIDHIDGDSENNRPENLRLICPNCHSLQPTFRNLNKGNGRKARREIYRNGVAVQANVA